ncbi:MAG: TetR/AcrR family transcriptional regulator [Hyphomonadaceae bacterium]|nr:TetR/AcrR family transcriptional regulator [Hyphomonadaceae bacterium]MBX3509872.1 TetR/AcrR family transcriptional regulator [Hyphomonadaceae bacterium]
MPQTVAAKLRSAPAKPLKRPARAQTREAVLKAAEKQFRAKGFHAVSLDGIAKAARLTKGAVYSNFQGKDDLLLAVLETHVRLSVERFSAARAGKGGATIEALATSLAKAAVEDAPWSACLAEFALHASRRPRIAKALAAVREKGRRQVIEMLRPIVDDGAASPERLERAALLFFALANGLTIERLSDPEQVTVELYRDALTRLLRP